MAHSGSRVYWGRGGVVQDPMIRPTDRLLLSAAHSIHDAEVTTAWLLA